MARKNAKTLRISEEVYDTLTPYWEADPHYSWNKLFTKLVEFAKKGGIPETATVGQTILNDDDEESGEENGTD